MAAGQDLGNSRKVNPIQALKIEAGSEFKKFKNAVSSVINELTNPGANLSKRNPNEKITFAGELKEALVSMATGSTLNALVLPPSNSNGLIKKQETTILALNASTSTKNPDLLLPPRINRSNQGKTA